MNSAGTMHCFFTLVPTAFVADIEWLNGLAMDLYSVMEGDSASHKLLNIDGKGKLLNSLTLSCPDMPGLNT